MTEDSLSAQDMEIGGDGIARGCRIDQDLNSYNREYPTPCAAPLIW